MLKHANQFVHRVVLRSFVLPLIALAGPMAAQNLSFERVALPVAGSLKSVHVADFNGDHALDIAVVNGPALEEGSVLVMLRNADGGYAAPLASPTGGTGSWGMAVGDLNQDGRLDVAVTNNTSSSISILLGNGDGTFNLAGSYPTDLSPTAIVAADFNHDGHLDLAVVNSGAGDVTILLGNGDGTFKTGTPIFLGGSPTDAVAGDFNGDGIVDLAVTNGALFSRVVVVLLGNGDGTFRLTQSATVGNEPISVAAGEFSQNRIESLAVADLASNSVSVLAGNGDGTFQPAATYGGAHGPAGIAVADFDSDGKLDLAVCNDVTGKVSVYPGNGDGTFQAATNFAVGGYPTSLTVGDLDGNGRNGIVTAGADGVVMLRNTTRR